MDFYLKRFLVPFIIFFSSFLVLFGIRFFVFKVLHSWAERTQYKIDNIILGSIRVPSILWCLVIALHIGVVMSDLSDKYVRYITKTADVIVIFSVSIAIANLVGRLFRNYVQTSNLPLPTTGLVYGIIKGAILAIGVLVILSVLGRSITPLVTALGVGGLAVALALQDTLGNLVSGIHILLEKAIRIGDFVKLETGAEGYVEDYTWRTTRVRMLPNNMVIIPNSKLAQSIVTNYYLREKRMSLLITIGVSYSSDPDKVERILIEEAKDGAGSIPGLLAEPEPFVRCLPGFGDSSLNFTLICQVAEFTNQYFAKHELRKRIFKRFQAEGIEIPFPQRTVYLREEKAWHQ